MFDKNHISDHVLIYFVNSIPVSVPLDLNTFEFSVKMLQKPRKHWELLKIKKS